MFIKSNMEVSVFYNKGEHSIELKPQTITYVDDAIVTAKELVDCYGQRISILPEEIVKEIMAEGASTGDEEVDDFLNGKTDVVPEGTEEITEEEAKKLAEEKAAKEVEEAMIKAYNEAPEECKPCHDGKAPSEEQCEKCKAEKAAKEAEEAKKLEEEKNAKAKTTKASAKNGKTGKSNK